jgi:hypothetical protein
VYVCEGRLADATMLLRAQRVGKKKNAAAVCLPSLTPPQLHGGVGGWVGKLALTLGARGTHLFVLGAEGAHGCFFFFFFFSGG